MKSSYYPKDNVNANTYDDIEQKESLMTFMNILTTVLIDEFMHIMIPKVWELPVYGKKYFVFYTELQMDE